MRYVHGNRKDGLTRVRSIRARTQLRVYERADGSRKHISAVYTRLGGSHCFLCRD